MKPLKREPNYGRFCGLAVGILSIIALFLWVAVPILSLDRGGPSYGGRTLTRWLENPNLAGREEAVRAIGTNAIPFLLRMAAIRYHNHELRSVLMERIVPGQHPDCFMAESGFAILGECGRPAVPALAEITKSKDNDIRAAALESLLHTNPDKDSLLPVLMRLSRDTNYGIRSVAGVHFIQRYSEDAARAGITEDYLERRDTLLPCSPQYLPPTTN
jgi:hypothetical protein